MREFAIVAIGIIWISGFVGADMALGGKYPNYNFSFLHTVAAVAWPIWVPGLVVYRVVAP